MAHESFSVDLGKASSDKFKGSLGKLTLRVIKYIFSTQRTQKRSKMLTFSLYRKYNFAFQFYKNVDRIPKTVNM
jgi:hypothetical protein